MLKKSVVTVTLLTAMFLCASAGPLEAQVPAGKWWHMPGVIKKLELSDGQIKQLDSLIVQNRLKLIDLKSALEKERFELQNLLEKDPLDEKAVLNQYPRLQAARSKLDAERFSFLLDVRKILGVERFQHLEMLVKDFREKNLRKPVQNQRPGREFGTGESGE